MTHDAVLAAARDRFQHLTFYGFRIEVRSAGGEIPARDLIEVARHPISGSACIIQALQVPRFSALRHSVSRWLCQPD